MVHVFNQYEQQLDDITHANWDTHYLSNEARVNERNSFLQCTLGGVKIGSLVGRICKLLHLNCFECVRKFFSCGDLQVASQIIKDTIKLINDKNAPPPSTLPHETKQALFERATLVFNTLLDSVNAKRDATEQLPISLRINLAELLADGRQEGASRAFPNSPAIRPIATPPDASENTEPAAAPKAKKKSRRKTAPTATATTSRRSTRLAIKPTRV